MKLSIIIPAYNEQDTLSSLVQDLQGVNFPIEHEIIIVDDASIDRTQEKEFLIKLKSRAEQNNVRIFKNRINRGKGFSVRKGIRRAKGDVIIVQDADRELDPNDIPRLIEPIIRGESSVVYGSRFLGTSWPDKMTLPCWLANKFLTLLTNILYGINISDVETCYKAFRADVVKSLDLRANRFTFDPEVTALISRRNIPIRELPISYHCRTSRQGKKIKAIDFFYAVLALLVRRFF
jgi:glycosyltransferase involved in cell wall biosynthesis